MKADRRLHGAIVVGALTTMMLLVDLGVYIGTGRSKLIDFSAKLKTFIFLNKRRVDRIEQIQQDVHRIDTKLDMLNKKIDEHEINHHNVSRKDISMRNLMEKSTRPHNPIIRTVNRTTIIARKKPVETPKLPDGLFEQLMGAGDINEVDKVISQNPGTNFNVPFMTIRRFQDRDAYLRYKEKVRKFGNRPGLDNEAEKTVVSVKNIVDTMKDSKKNKNRPVMPTNGVNFKKFNGVSFGQVNKTGTPETPEARSRRDIEVQKAQQKINKVLGDKTILGAKESKDAPVNLVPFPTNNPENYVRQDPKKDQSDDSAKEERERKANAIIKRKKEMARLFRRDKMRHRLRQRRIENLRNMEMKQKELMMLQALRNDNRELVRSNVELIKMTHDLIKNVNNTKEKLKQLKNETKEEQKKVEKIHEEGEKEKKQEERRKLEQTIKNKTYQDKINQKEKAILDEIENIRKVTIPKVTPPTNKAPVAEATK